MSAGFAKTTNLTEDGRLVLFDAAIRANVEDAPAASRERV
jgi:hypothetical protein